MKLNNRTYIRISTNQINQGPMIWFISPNYSAASARASVTEVSLSGSAQGFCKIFMQAWLISHADLSRDAGSIGRQQNR